MDIREVVLNPETPSRPTLVQEGRLLDAPFHIYDTAHVVFQPKRMSVQELREAYNWLCAKSYSTPQILKRGARA